MTDLWLVPEGQRFRVHVDLAELLVPLDGLRPYYRNARNGDVDLIADSLVVNGQYRPITVNRGSLTGRPNEVLVGNHTYAAALSLDWTHIAATFVDVDEDSARRIVLVDNQSSDVAWMDHGLLAELLQEQGVDLSGTAFTPEDVTEVLAGLERQAEALIGFVQEEPVKEEPPPPPPPAAPPLPPEPDGPARLPSGTRDVVLVYPVRADHGRTIEAFGMLVSRGKRAMGLSPGASVSEVVFSALALASEPLPPLPKRPD